MLGSKNKATGQYDTIISNKTEFEGNLKFSGGLHVEGRIKGNLLAEDQSGALVRISDGGSVEGEIRAPNVVIHGKVTGTVYSSQHLELGKSAMVDGDVHYTMMEMVMGAQVNGQLIHEGEIKGKKGRKVEPGLKEAHLDLAAESKAGNE